MKKFAKEQMDCIQQQVTQILDQLSEGKNARDICAQMYVDGLEDKTVAQGEAMADSIMESIDTFDHDYARAKADVDAFVDSFIDEACKDKSLAERCTYLMKLIAAISGAKSTLEAKTEEERVKAQNMVDDAEATQVLEGEATDALEAMLREQLKNALRGSNILVSALEAQNEKLREIESEDEAAALLVEAGTRDNDFRAIMAMQAYINIKNGVYADIPSDLTAAQVATMVCTYTEEIHILHEVEDNNLGEEVAHTLLSILGTVALIDLASGAVAFGTMVCINLFGWILTVPAILVVLTTAWHEGKRIVEAWHETSGKIVHYTFVGVKAVYRDAARVLSFATTHAKPVLSWLAAKASTAVRRLLDVLHRGHNAKNPEPVCAEDLEEAVAEADIEEEILEEEEVPEYEAE